MQDCVFCKIAKKEAPSSIEFENDSVIAFKSIEPVAEIHILIVPKKHIDTFLDINDNTVLEMTKAAQQIIKEKKAEGGYKLVFNGGKYQAIKHLHWHLLAGELENKKDILQKT